MNRDSSGFPTHDYFTIAHCKLTVDLFDSPDRATHYYVCFQLGTFRLKTQKVVYLREEQLRFFYKNTRKVVSMPNQHAMYMYQGVELNLHKFITSEIDKRVQSVLPFGYLCPPPPKKKNNLLYTDKALGCSLMRSVPPSLDEQEREKYLIDYVSEHSQQNCLRFRVPDK